MLTLPRLLAILMLASAIVVVAHFILSHFYSDAIDTHTIWNILNWIMAAGVLVALTVNFMRRRAANGRDAGASSQQEHIGINAVFYASALLAIWFFWSWFGELTSGPEGPEDVVNSVVWVLVDGLYPLVIGSTACHLWCTSDA